MHPSFDFDPRTLRNTLRTCLILAVLTVASCTVTVVRCCGQTTRFEFNTTVVVTVDTSGNMEVLHTGLNVRAWADTLQAGPLKWWGITWAPTDGGDLYFVSPRFRAHYRPGPDGKGLLVCPEGRLKTIEFHEKKKHE